MNIQTKADNAPSIALAKRIGALPCWEACFSFQRADGTTAAYAGFRNPWAKAVEDAALHLRNSHVVSDDDTDNFNHSSGPTP